MEPLALQAETQAEVTALRKELHRARASAAQAAAAAAAAAGSRVMHRCVRNVTQACMRGAVRGWRAGTIICAVGERERKQHAAAAVANRAATAARRFAVRTLALRITRQVTTRTWARWRWLADHARAQRDAQRERRLSVQATAGEAAQAQ